MLQGWVVIAVALGYIGLLFVDRELWRPHAAASRAGARRAADDLSAVAGDLLHVLDVLRLGRPRLAHRLRLPDDLYRPDPDDRPRARRCSLRIVRLAKAQNITSIADFIAARYGKSQAVAATVALIAIVGIDPLHRAPAQSGVVLARDDPRHISTRRTGARAAGARRHRAVRRARRWRPSRSCSARAISTPPSIRTA